MRNKPKTCICIVCGNKFKTKSHAVVKYCSKYCQLSVCNERRKCKRCGCEFWFKKSENGRKKGNYCSAKCYQGKRIKAECTVCKTIFEVKPYKIKKGEGKYCGQECYSKYQRRNRIEAECSICRKFFSMGYAEGVKRLQESKSGKIFCSQECWCKYNRGENVYNYNKDRVLQEQIRGSYKATEWKKLVLFKDGFTCVKCDNIENLEVHHIKEFSKILEDNNIKSIEKALRCEELWDVNNGTTLCVECHAKEHPDIGIIQMRANILKN